ncbi:hypothetical protein CO615_06550 [Lysobacteraceae bacterium NML75-0749]|nr:hypothetical protein CO615_06550 [Xanthomonadaceae bacterium NML75-0749]PJJ99699.1 hypothetical protein CO611_04310 [Xanthomonadaceae bacterium NML03-0222]PJK05991.1 hypothetical protein CO609_03440 [Xanthomonadaceae bacterium NML91-0268]
MKKAWVVAAMVLALAACGDDRSLSQKAGSVLSGSATDFVAGLGEGVDKKMTLELLLDPAFEANGLTVTLGKSRGVGSKDASVYIVSAKPFKGAIMARALDESGTEIGRSRVEVEFAEDDAKYVNFNFNEEMDSQLVRSYALSLR